MPNHVEFKRQCGAEFSALVFSLISVISVILRSLCVGVCGFDNVGRCYCPCLCCTISKKRNTPFRSHHYVEFGLQVCERSTGARPNVVTPVCRFCEVFGNEEAVVGRKRSRLDRAKYFKAPFCKEKYYSHNKRVHIAKQTEYCELDASTKKSFFEIGSSSGSQATLHAFSGPHSIPLRMLINKDIVDIIIGDMMFHPEDMDGVTRARLIAIFVPTLDSSEDAAESGDVSWYAIIISNTKQFQLFAQYFAAGLSFHQVAQVILETKYLLGIGSIGLCSEGVFSRCACFICGMNMQCIVELLRKFWAFSVVLDVVTHIATAYYDVCIRICHKSTVHDFHLLSIPVHDWHTGKIIFNTFAKSMDALYSD